MIVLAVLLAVATARGDVPQAEEGEDVDLTTPPDWVTVGKLVGVLVLNLLLVNIARLGDHRRAALRRLRLGARQPHPGARRASSARSCRSPAGTSSTALGVPLAPGILDGIL